MYTTQFNLNSKTRSIIMSRLTLTLIFLSFILVVTGCCKKPQMSPVESFDTPEQGAIQNNNATQNTVNEQKTFDALYATFNAEYLPEKRIPVFRFDQDAFKKLIQSGMDVNARNEQGQTLLMLIGDNDIMKALIEAGIDVNAKDNNGWTALMNIAESTHCVEDLEEGGEEEEDCLDILLAAGVDVNLKDNDGKTALMHIWDLPRDCGPENYMDSRVYIKRIIKANANVNEKDTNGNTPLMYAVYPESVKALIAAGADVNAKNKDGMTPLMYAEFPESVQALIDAGADVNARDNNGMTAFMYAFARQYLPCRDEMDAPQKVFQIFKRAGADLNAKDNQGKSLFDHVVDVCSKSQSEKNCRSKCSNDLDVCKAECGHTAAGHDKTCISECKKVWLNVCNVKCEQLQNGVDRIIAQYDYFPYNGICNDEEQLTEIKKLISDETKTQGQTSKTSLKP